MSENFSSDMHSDDIPAWLFYQSEDDDAYKMFLSLLFLVRLPEPILLLLVAKERNERKTEETKLKL